MPDPDRLRNLPSVASLLEPPETRQLLARVPRTVVVEAIRRTISVFRREASGIEGPFRSREEWTALLLFRLPTEIGTGEPLLPPRPQRGTDRRAHGRRVGARRQQQCRGRSPLPGGAGPGAGGPGQPRWTRGDRRVLSG